MARGPDLGALSPDQRNAVFRRRRAAVAVVAVVLVVAGALVVRTALGGDTDAAEDAEPDSTTTLVERPAGPCGSMPTSLPDQVSQLVMIGIDPANPSAVATVLDRHPQLGGVFVGGGGLAALRDQTFQNSVRSRGTFVAVDDEGGRVQRMEAVAGELPSARRQAAEWSVERISSTATERARLMRELAVSVNFAPVVDVSSQADGDIIGDRSYGSDPDAVIRNAGAFAAGMRAGGVMPVLKHFPGHGRASGDSHDGAVLTPAVDDLRSLDLLPYQALIDERPVALMVGHLDVPGLTEPSTPASLSPATYRLVREEVPFGGLVFTDDLAGMAAITDRMTPAEAAERAIAAGADVALLSSALDPSPVIERLAEAVSAGRISRLRLDAAWLNVAEEKLALGLATCEQLVGDRRP